MHVRIPVVDSKVLCNRAKERNVGVIFMDIREHAIPLFINADTLPVTFMYYKTVATPMHNINNNNSPPHSWNKQKLFVSFGRKVLE